MKSYPTPEGIVRVEPMNDTFTKFHLDNGQVLHRFTKADPSECFHDHPYSFTSHVLVGGYREEIATVHPDGSHSVVRIDRLPNTSHEVRADTIHRLVELLDGECYTLIQPGPKERTSGFYEFRPNGPYRRDWNGDWVEFKSS